MVDIVNAIKLRYIVSDRGVKCHTEGLSKFGHREIQVWHLDVDSAGKLLNFVCHKILNKKQGLEVGQVVDGYGLVPFCVMEAVSPNRQRAFQLVYNRKHPAVRPGLLPPPTLMKIPISRYVTCDHVRPYENAEELG